MGKKLTTSDFITKSKEIHNDLFDYSLVEYKNTTTNVRIICSKHGEFEQTPKNHMKGSGCPHCAIENRYDTQRKSSDKFTEESKVVHDDKYDYSKVNYQNNKKKVKIICKEHGEFEQIPSHHLNGIGCPFCSENKLTTQMFIDKSKEKHGDKYDYTFTEYTNQQTPVKIICPVHGEFEQKPKYHMKGSGCPECNDSKGEKLVKKFLTENGIKFEPQHKFDDCKNILPLPFDFFLPDYNTCIEYDGEQHFKPKRIFGGEEGFLKTKINDKIKDDFCNTSEINLIRIKYDENINNKLNKFFNMK